MNWKSDQKGDQNKQKVDSLSGSKLPEGKINIGKAIVVVNNPHSVAKNPPTYLLSIPQASLKDSFHQVSGVYSLGIPKRESHAKSLSLSGLNPHVLGKGTAEPVPFQPRPCPPRRSMFFEEDKRRRQGKGSDDARSLLHRDPRWSNPKPVSARFRTVDGQNPFCTTFISL